MKKYIILALILGFVLVTPVFAQTSIADQIAALQRQIVELQAKLAELLNSQRPDFCWDFNRDLKLGDGGMGGGARARNDVDNDVNSLRRLLTQEGIAKLISEDGYPGISMIESAFDNQTQTAVK